MPTYLVTGAAGFIGHHLVAALRASGAEVLAVDTGLHAGAEEQIDRLRAAGATFLRADLTDPTSVAALPEVAGVYHLAALNGTANFYDRPWQTLRHSTLPTLLLLERYARSPLEFFFYAGSSESYASMVSTFDCPVPTPEEVPLGITDPRHVRWSYGASKLHGEVAAFAAAAEHGLSVAVGRFHNVYGPQMGTDHVIPDFIERGMRGVFRLYGGHHTRSFIYVDDAVRATIAVATQAQGEVVNIGSPTEISMIELARVIMAQAGWQGEVEVLPGPANSVARRCPDITRLSHLIDTTAFTALPEGIDHLLDSLGIRGGPGSSSAR